MHLWLDRETWSELDLKEVGTYRYADHAEDLLVAYAIDDGPALVWDVTAEECHDELWQAMQDAEEVTAHNAQFDKAVHNGPAQRHLPRIELERWRCSMAQALSHALPAGLADLCQVLNVPDDMAKLKEGKKLLHLFTRPQPANRKIRRATRHTHPEEWQRFKNYAAHDIIAMRECVRRMPRWNWNESAVAEWHCDQRINERGFFIDRELTQAGITAAETEKARIGARFRELTFGIVDRPSQRAQFMDYLNDMFGLDLDNTRSDTFLQHLKSDKLDSIAAELMRLSIMSNKTSTAKYAALDPAIQEDGRFRGALQFSGAGRTRRWAGRLFQAHNLPSRGLPPSEWVEQYIEMLKLQCHDLYFEDLMRYGAAALRGLVISEEGKKLEVADLSNIEGRMLAWVANEQWKLKAFREYDTIVGYDEKGKEKRLGPDLYNITAVSIIGGDPWNVAKVDRNVFGKVPDLASGYQGGVAGYQTFAKSYNVRMADHWETMQRMLPTEIIQKAIANHGTHWGAESQASLEISDTEWIASEACKLAWRARHPATVKFWYALQNAAKDAINNWNQPFTVGAFIQVKCVTYKTQRWMVVQLPSGRFLTYFSPRLVRGRQRADGSYDYSIVYEGEAAEAGKTTRMWSDIFTHGGKMTGNVCQTLARDILMPALQEAEQEGYLPVLSVHDEAVCEVPDDDRYNAEGLISILARDRGWTAGLPLSAAGFETYRYRKD